METGARPNTHSILIYLIYSKVVVNIDLLNMRWSC